MAEVYEEHGDAERGREAEGPLQIPRRGWMDVLKRVKSEISHDHLDIVAGGVAFYALLAIFPALAAALSIYGIVADPQTVAQQITQLSAALPQSAQQIVEGQLSRIATSGSGALSVGVVLGILGSLWSAGKGVKALMEGLNITYDEQDERGFLKLNAIALGLTLLSIVAVLLAITLVAAVPAVLDTVGLGQAAEIAIAVLRWPLIALGVMAWLGVMYRYGPDRHDARWRWLSAGSIVATLLWMAISAGFSIYVDQFGNYNETYGALGGVIVLMFWLWLSAYFALIGAELNSELEHQTRRDSTTGGDQPMGERGAFVADNLGETP